MPNLTNTPFQRVATMKVEREHIDETDRTVPIAISSEMPSREWYGTLVLEHSKKAIDLSRGAENGFPLLWRHGDEMLGRVTDVRLSRKDKVLRGVAKFGSSQIALEKWQDVVDGVLTDISVGGSLLEEPERQEDESYLSRAWQVTEVSFVPVPADPSVGVNREMEKPGASVPDQSIQSVKREAADMPDENTGGDGAATQGDGINVADFTKMSSKQRLLVEREVKEAERKRITGVREAFSLHLHRGQVYEDLQNACIEQGIGVEKSREHLLDLIGGEKPEPLADDFIQREETGSLDQQTMTDIKRRAHGNQPAGSGVITAPGADEMDKYMEGATQLLLVRTGLDDSREARDGIRKGHFGGMDLLSLAREYLRITRGGATGIYDKRNLVGEAFMRQGVIGHSTSDFANLLENIAAKNLMRGWDEAEENWNVWCRQGDLPDFRPGSRTNLSTFEDLEIVYENGEYKYGSVSDLKEPLQLLTYGKLFNISRQAIISDDLEGISTIPRKMGRAANRKIGDLAYGVLTANAALNQDATALFDAAHNNLVGPGSGAAPSVATVEAGRTAMALQTDPKGNTLGIRPAYILTPEALSGTASALMAAQYDPAASLGTMTPNTVQNLMQPVANHRLDADDPLQWYMLADQNIHDTVEVAFLDGQREPYMEMKDGWTVDGVEHKVRIDATAVALDFRTMYQNDGN